MHLALRLVMILFVCLAVACGESSNNTPDTGPDLASDQPDTLPVDADGDLDTDNDGVADGDMPEPAAFAVRMDFSADGQLFDQPFPSETWRTATGVDVSRWPGRNNSDYIGTLLEILQTEVDGFGRTSAIYFPLTGAANPAGLPQPSDSSDPGAALQLLVVDPNSPLLGARFPFTSMYEDWGGPHGADNLVSMLPIQGVPLPPGTLMAAVITDDLLGIDGDALEVPGALAQLLAGEQPAGMPAGAFAEYQAAITQLSALADVDTARLRGLTVFRTADPTRALREAASQTIAAGAPTPAPFVWSETFDDYCVYESSIAMPVFQGGVPPFVEGGGAWVTDANGLVQQGTEDARIFVSLPRTAQPPGGFPLVVFVRTGGGGDRPHIDRGLRAEDGGPPLVPGSGPSVNFSRGGWAAIGVDGPHGGNRNITNGDEQYLMFNITNPLAMRDNVRQSALELVLFAEILDDIHIDASSCPGLADSDVGFDVDLVALMGHSMGATIAPLVLANQPRYRAVILSGAGGSWIENLVHKQRPLPTRPIAETLLGYVGSRTLHSHDAALSLLQWAGEAADPPLYASEIMLDPTTPPRHVLMLQGIADTYILPPIANALSLPLGLDSVGDELDRTHPTTAVFVPLRDMLPFASGTVIQDYPVAHNFTRFDTETSTAVVVQHLEDGIEDGHEVVFQTEGPKLQYRCFLETWAASGTPSVVAPGAEWDPCP